MALRMGRRAGGAGRPGVEDERGVRAEGGAGHPALEEVVWATLHPALEEVVWATAVTAVRQQKGLYSPASTIRCTI